MIPGVRHLIVGLSIVFVLANHLQAASISIEPQKDAAMFLANPTNTGGGNTFFGTGRNQNGASRRALIQFDIDGNIPAGATINSVSLTLYLRAWSGSGTGGLFGNDRTVVLHELTNDWGDGTTVATTGGGGQGTASIAPGDVSWNNRYFSPSTPWATAGGDFEAASSASLVITSATALNDPVTWTGAGLVADAQAWLDTPADNNGWILLIPNDLTAPNSTLLEFHSKEAAADFRPVLNIDYTEAEPAAVPEPATWLLAASGLLFFGLARAGYRRRRGAAG